MFLCLLLLRFFLCVSRSVPQDVFPSLCPDSYSLLFFSFSFYMYILIHPRLFPSLNASRPVFLFPFFPLSPSVLRPLLSLAAAAPPRCERADPAQKHQRTRESVKPRHLCRSNLNKIGERFGYASRKQRQVGLCVSACFKHRTSETKNPRREFQRAPGHAWPCIIRVSTSRISKRHRTLSGS